MQPNLLQSHIWEQYSQLEGHKTIYQTGDNFQYLAVKHDTPLGSYLYCPYGPTLKFQSPQDSQNSHDSPASKASQTSQTSQKASQTSQSLQTPQDSSTALTSLTSALSSLKSLARSQDAFFVRLEPTFPFSPKALKSLHLVKSHDLNPAHTWVLDLTPSESELTSGFNRDNYRHWRNRQKQGITIRTSQDPDDITILTTFLKSIGERNHFTPQDEAHLQNQLKSGFATLYIAELSPLDPTSSISRNEPSQSISTPDNSALTSSVNQPQSVPIAAALCYDYNGTRFYAHAATDRAYRSLRAGTSILIQMILDAKASGAKAFDFWGITTSSDPSHPWYGFTQYKKSFGGHAVDYSGTWDLPIHPIKYRLYQLLRYVNRLRRRS